MWPGECPRVSPPAAAEWGTCGRTLFGFLVFRCVADALILGLPFGIYGRPSVTDDRAYSEGQREGFTEMSKVYPLDLGMRRTVDLNPSPGA